MAEVFFSLSLGNIRGLQNAILDAAANHIRAGLHRAKGPIQQRIGQAASDAIRHSPEYTSLLEGQLRAELGVTSAVSLVLDRIAENIKEGCRVSRVGARRVGSDIEGGLRIELLRGDYSEVLKVSGASFTSEGGYQIDWLRWLTLEGDSILVADHHIAYGFPARSRTGSAIMVRAGKWRVPAEFAGVAEDNWLTRALLGLGPAFEEILREELQRAI